MSASDASTTRVDRWVLAIRLYETRSEPVHNVDSVAGSGARRWNDEANAFLVTKGGGGEAGAVGDLADPVGCAP